MKSSPAFMVFAFCMGFAYMAAPTYHENIHYDRVSLYAIIFYLCVLKYASIPYSRLFHKIRWSFPVIWASSCIVFNLVLYWDFPLVWHPANDISYLVAHWGESVPRSASFQNGAAYGVLWLLYKPIFAAWMYWKTYSLEKRYSMQSDPLNATDVFICLWRPQNARSVAQSLLGLSIGSVCIYSGGKLYGFKRGSCLYHARVTEPYAIDRKFIAVNTGMQVDWRILSMLDSLVGTPAGILRVRCIYVIRHILRHIDPKLTPVWHELIPARYGIKLLRWRHGR